MNELTKEMVKELVKRTTNDRIVSVDVYAEGTQAEVVVKSRNNSYRELVIPKRSIEYARCVNGLYEIDIYYYLFGCEKFFDTKLYLLKNEYEMVVGA